MTEDKRSGICHVPIIVVRHDSLTVTIENLIEAKAGLMIASLELLFLAAVI